MADAHKSDEQIVAEWLEAWRMAEIERLIYDLEARVLGNGVPLRARQQGA
jgi:hypothetical protein